MVESGYAWSASGTRYLVSINLTIFFKVNLPPDLYFPVQCWRYMDFVRFSTSPDWTELQYVCMWNAVRQWNSWTADSCLNEGVSFRPPPPTASAIWKTCFESGSRKDLHVLTKHELSSISFLGSEQIPEPVGMCNQEFKLTLAGVWVYTDIIFLNP